MKVTQTQTTPKQTTFGEIPANTCFELSGAVYKKVQNITGDSPRSNESTVAFGVFLFKLSPKYSNFVVENNGEGYVFEDKTHVRIVEIDEIKFHLLN